MALFSLVFLKFTCLFVSGLSCNQGFLVVACGIQFPNQGSNPGPLPWEHRVLAIGSPGKPSLIFNFEIISPKISVNM